MTATQSVARALQPAALEPIVRPTVRGKFLFAGDAKLYVRGATYGTFALDENQREIYDPEVVERDFTLMEASGLNAVRTYTVPPRWLLDAAERHRLRVMVGLPWEQHVAFLDEPARGDSIERRVREDVRRCAKHPAILCYIVGNEIPSGVVRWSGRRRVERFIERLFDAVKAEDPTALVSYVNYPTTEYLALPFLDFVCFNVYLETPEKLRSYLPRLQNIAGDRPLVMAEVGLDSRRHGEGVQARTLDWQLETIFASGCAGVFVYAWTDEWHRGGFAIEDWDFGVTRRDRAPKPALKSVEDAFAEVPFRGNIRWPRISVVVCAFNARSTIRECLHGLQSVDYPDFEVIVVNDGSTDGTGAIASEYPVRLISTPNRGLSSARNTGLGAATGEIVAYLDSDAFPDPDWLKYLAYAFITSEYAGIGGPNVAPPGLGTRADCFDNAPGGPTHVLLSDVEAEHIPGCNMAFRKERLAAVGGFDPALRVAGDDVDVCWKLQARSWRLGFAPGALVWHHRRTTLRSYWKQQRGYGRAEALLEQKWPEKYNAMGHPSWGGRIYTKGVAGILGFGRARVYQGPFGSAPFQSLERPPARLLWSLSLMPEWYLIIAALGAFSLLGLLWRPLFLALPLFAVAGAMPLVQALRAASGATFESKPRSRAAELQARTFTGFLYVVQPLARLAGRIEYGLTWWRSRTAFRPSMMHPRAYSIWNERWQSATAWLEGIEKHVRRAGGVTARGGGYDAWDMEVRSGALGSAKLRMLLEEHGAGRQLARFRSRPIASRAALGTSALFGVLAVAAGVDGAWAACAVLAALGAGIVIRTVAESAAAMERIDRALGGLHAISDRQR